MDARQCAAAVVRRDRGAGVDVRLVIDVSGSMKSGDPEYLRQDVLNGLGEMLPPGSRAGVWTFGQNGRRGGSAWCGRRRVAPQRACRAHVRSARKRRAPISTMRLTKRRGMSRIHRPTAAATSFSSATVASMWRTMPSSNDAQRRAIVDRTCCRGCARRTSHRLSRAVGRKPTCEFLKQIADATHGHVGRADTVAAVKEYLATRRWTGLPDADRSRLPRTRRR